MKKQNKQICSVRRPAYTTRAFTLVELIVVITILAILGTIAFISLQWYSSQARDSKRISDIQNIKKSLELFSLNTWKYPKPDDYNTVSYTWELIWYQWTVWEQVSTNLSRNLNEKPTDPLIEEEYIYSTSNSQTEYEVLGLYENNMLSNLQLFEKTNAANLNFAKIEWNFNWLYAKTPSFYIPTPSIINWNVWWNVDFAEDEILIESQVITWWDNIPWESTWWLDITLSPYEWTITANSTEEEKLELVEAIQTAYSWSVLENDTVYANILSKTSTWEMLDFVDVVVLEVAEYTSLSSNNEWNWWEESVVYSCDETSKPTDNGHISYIIWNPTEENQTYIQDGDNCWYVCEEWYEYSVWDNECMLSECSWSIVVNATSNATTQSYGTPWSYNTTPWDCTFSCNTNYTWDSDSCEADTQSCSITNGTGTQIWNWSSWETCQVTTCWVDYYNPWNNTCSVVWVWYYSNSTSISRVACTNKSANNSQYTSDWNWANNCSWECINWYTWADCNIQQSLITSTDCTNAWWYWVTNDVYIGSTPWDWFCISPIFWDWNSNSNTWNWWISFNGWWNDINTYTNWWNPTSIDDSWNPYPKYGQTKILEWADASSNVTTYWCKALWTASSDYDTSDTIIWRMKWLATTWNSYTEAQSIDWVTWINPINWHAVPALFVADCIDWVKDLWTTMSYTDITDTEINTSTTNTSTTDNVITYSEYSTNVTLNTDTAYLSNTTYQNRQKYLTAWTQKSGSHLPSAFSYITSWKASANDDDWDLLTWNSRWEYQVACEAWLFWAVTNDWTQYTWSSDDINNERIWISAIGNNTGTSWGRYARIIGGIGCGNQGNNGTSIRNGTTSARFVVRP